MVFALFLIMVILVATVPYAQANADKYPGYVARKRVGSPALPALLSSLGALMPSPGLENPSESSPTLPSVSAVCSFSSPFLIGGVVSAPGGQFIERWDTGDLWFYNTTSRTCNFVHSAPAGGSCSPGSRCGYYGIASKDTLVALISWGVKGLWTCTFSTLQSHKCASVSAFIRLPHSFCSSMLSRFCNPDGAAIDKAANLWYVDVVNGVEVELTSASTYSQVGVVHFYRAPVDGIAIDLTNGNHWVSDYTCAGDVFLNGALVSQAGDALGSIALSKLNPHGTTHVYVGVTAACGNYRFAFVGDQNEFVILPTPFTSSNPIPGISAQLFFSSFFRHVWSTKDTV
jgi:hypothetical protein